MVLEITYRSTLSPFLTQEEFTHTKILLDAPVSKLLNDVSTREFEDMSRQSRSMC